MEPLIRAASAKVFVGLLQCGVIAGGRWRWGKYSEERARARERDEGWER